MARHLAAREPSPLALSAGQLIASSVLTGLTLPVLGRQALHLHPASLAVPGGTAGPPLPS